MNCTDIQINDWVYLSEKSYPMRVSSIDIDHCCLDFEGNEGDPFDGIYGEDGIAPIPLTAEMMELNYGEYGWITWHWANDSIRVTMSVAGDFGVMVMSGDFRFVHELQHALRLCGCNDKADDFKIK